MSRRTFSILVLGALALSSSVAADPVRAADTVPWIVGEASGSAEQRQVGGGWVVLTAGSVLAPGAQVRTGADGRLSLSHGKDRVMVSPGSEFAIPRGVDPATGPSVIQRLGTMLFRIEHRPDRHFEVEGPYLAAVVKGTVFTVNATALEDQVHVAEGAVQVTAPLAHSTALVRPGQTAVVTSSGKSMSILGTPTPGDALRRRSDADDPGKSGAKSADAAPAAPATGPRITRTLGDAPLDTEALSGGLVSGPGGAGRGIGAARGRAGDLETPAAGSAATTGPGHGGNDGRVTPPGLASAVAGIAGANTGGGNANAGRGNAFAGGGNANAGGGNAFAGAGNAAGGNPNAHGGNPNAGGGNPNAGGGNPNAGGGNPNAGGGNPNAGGGNANAGGGNPNAGGGNPNAGGPRH